jgi:hypothetical protein
MFVSIRFRTFAAVMKDVEDLPAFELSYQHSHRSSAKISELIEHRRL